MLILILNYKSICLGLSDVNPNCRPWKVLKLKLKTEVLEVVPGLWLSPQRLLWSRARFFSAIWFFLFGVGSSILRSRYTNGPLWRKKWVARKFLIQVRKLLRVFLYFLKQLRWYLKSISLRGLIQLKWEGLRAPAVQRPAGTAEIVVLAAGGQPWDPWPLL